MAPTFDTLSDHDFEIDEDEIDFSGTLALSYGFRLLE